MIPYGLILGDVPLVTYPIVALRENPHMICTPDSQLFDVNGEIEGYSIFGYNYAIKVGEK